MMTQNIRELTVLKKTNEITSEQILNLAKKVKVKRAQKPY